MRQEDDFRIFTLCNQQPVGKAPMPDFHSLGLEVSGIQFPLDGLQEFFFLFASQSARKLLPKILAPSGY